MLQNSIKMLPMIISSNMQDFSPLTPPLACLILLSWKHKHQSWQVQYMLLCSEEGNLYITAHLLNLKSQFPCWPALTHQDVRTAANPGNSSMLLTGLALIIPCAFAMVQTTSCELGYLSLPRWRLCTQPETGWRTNCAKHCCIISAVLWDLQLRQQRRII